MSDTPQPFVTAESGTLLPDAKAVWVVMNKSKTNIQWDGNGKPWFSYNKSEADRLCKVLELDFNNPGCFSCELRDATKLIAKYRHDIEIKRPETFKEAINALATKILERPDHAQS